MSLAVIYLSALSLLFFFFFNPLTNDLKLAEEFYRLVVVIKVTIRRHGKISTNSCNNALKNKKKLNSLMQVTAW